MHTPDYEHAALSCAYNPDWILCSGRKYPVQTHIILHVQLGTTVSQQCDNTTVSLFTCIH